MLLQYQIDLEVAGYEDTGTNSAPIPVRRDEFKRYLNAITALNWTKSSVTVPLGNSSEHFDREVIVTASSTGKWVSFTQLPSIIRETPGRSWTLENIHFEPVEFTSNVDQDLLVLVERV